MRIENLSAYLLMYFPRNYDYAVETMAIDKHYGIYSLWSAIAYIFYHIHKFPHCSTHTKKINLNFSNFLSFKMCTFVKLNRYIEVYGSSHRSRLRKFTRITSSSIFKHDWCMRLRFYCFSNLKNLHNMNIHSSFTPSRVTDCNLIEFVFFDF